MNTAIEYRDLGLVDYKEAWDYQEVLFNTILFFIDKYSNFFNSSRYAYIQAIMNQLLILDK